MLNDNLWWKVFIVFVLDKYILEVNIIFKGFLGVKFKGKYEGMDFKWCFYDIMIVLNFFIC